MLPRFFFLSRSWLPPQSLRSYLSVNSLQVNTEIPAIIIIEAKPKQAWTHEGVEDCSYAALVVIAVSSSWEEKRIVAASVKFYCTSEINGSSTISSSIAGKGSIESVGKLVYAGSIQGTSQVSLVFFLEAIAIDPFNQSCCCTMSYSAISVESPYLQLHLFLTHPSKTGTPTNFLRLMHSSWHPRSQTSTKSAPYTKLPLSLKDDVELVDSPPLIFHCFFSALVGLIINSAQPVPQVGSTHSMNTAKEEVVLTA